MGCVEEVELSSRGPETNKVSTRWVLTLKTKENGNRECTARLGVRVFEDLEKDVISVNSRLLRVRLRERLSKPAVRCSAGFIVGMLRIRSCEVSSCPDEIRSTSCFHLVLESWKE